MDRKLVSSQDHELDYLVRKYGVKRKDVRQAKNAVGVSRVKVVAWLILNDKIKDENLTDIKKVINETD